MYFFITFLLITYFATIGSGGSVVKHGMSGPWIFLIICFVILWLLLTWWFVRNAIYGTSSLNGETKTLLDNRNVFGQEFFVVKNSLETFMDTF